MHPRTPPDPARRWSGAASRATSRRFGHVFAAGAGERDVARGLDLQDRVRAHVARHHQPGAAAGDVLPELAMGAGGIVAQIDVVEPLLPGGIVGASAGSVAGRCTVASPR